MAEKGKKPSATAEKSKTKAEPSTEKTAKKAKSAEERSVKKTQTAAEEPKVSVTAEKKNERKSVRKESGSGGVAAILKNKKYLTILISAVSFVLVIAIVLGIVFGAKSCNGSFGPTISSNPVAVSDAPAAEITGGYEKGSSKAPQTSTYVRELSPSEIVKPVEGVHDEHEKYGVETYPSYGKSLGKVPTAEFTGMVQECRSLIPYPTWHSDGSFDAIDKDGYLLKNGERILYSGSSSSGGVETDEGDDGMVNDPTVDLGGSGVTVDDGSSKISSQYNEQYRKLYRHTTADTLYGGGLSDSEPRIVKTIDYITRGGSGAIGSKQITGLYAPAGELIKIEVSEEDLAEAGGSFHVYIGQNYNIDGQDGVSLEWVTSPDGYTTGKTTGINRMSNILSHFVVNSTTSYVGSFWGGPIYIRPTNNKVEHKISVTISGGVKYQHFILGVTTPEEYEYNAGSTAPYFDLEVYDSAIRFTTGIAGAERLRKMTYEDCTDAAVLWDKITQVSKRVQANGLTSSTAPVNFIGDCFIAAGAAYANPGRNGVVCPPSWVSDALNYSAFVNSGSWGAMHEYNHCWQGYGFGNGGEVSNNATTLVSYTLYTRISQSRTSAVGWGNGGWNRFTDPSKSLGEALTIQATTNAETNKPQPNFDLSAYATLIHNIGQDMFLEAAHGGREAGTTVYYNQLVNATHLDMTYYFTDILNFTVGGEANGKGNVTQAAVDAAKAQHYPVFVPVSSVYQVGRSIIYDNAKQYITTAQPFSYGTGAFTMDFNNGNNFGAGKFTSKALVIPDGITAKVVNVTQPENGTVEKLANNQVKYTPKAGAAGLYSGNFIVTLQLTKDDGAFDIENVDLVINLKQSNETNLNRTTYVYDSTDKVPDTASVYNEQTGKFDFGEYATTETKKNVCTQETNTQIWQAGWNYDDDTYNKNSTNYRVMPNNLTLQTMEGAMYSASAGTYRFTLKGRGIATLYLSYDKGATWESALTINRSKGNAYIDTEYAEHEFSSDNNYVLFKVVLLVVDPSNFFAVGFAVQNEDGTFPAYSNTNAFATSGVDLHQAITEESAKKFTTEYRYKNEYKYTYNSTETVPVTENTLVSVSHDPWDDTRLIDFLFDGKSDSWYHSLKNVYITDSAPFELVVDLGSVHKVNTVTFNGYTGNIGNNGMVKSFQIWGSLDGENYFLVTEQTDSAANARTMTFSFDAVEMRYYKLIVTKTDNGRYFAMNSIVFSHKLIFDKGIQIAPNDDSVRYTGNAWGAENVLANFGHVYKAGAGDSVEFTFTGTRFAYFAYQSADYGTVDIYLDGKKIAEKVDLSADKNMGDIAYMYTGDALDNKEHVVKIVGNSGKFNVDSFAYWN